MTSRRLLCCLLLCVSGCKINFGPSDHSEPKPPAVSESIRSANRAYFIALADQYESHAKSVESGEVTTVREAAERARDSEKPARDEWKQTIGRSMQSELGADDLLPNAAATFRAMSAEFRRAAR